MHEEPLDTTRFPPEYVQKAKAELSRRWVPIPRDEVYLWSTNNQVLQATRKIFPYAMPQELQLDVGVVYNTIADLDSVDSSDRTSRQIMKQVSTTPMTYEQDIAAFCVGKEGRLVKVGIVLVTWTPGSSNPKD